MHKLELLQCKKLEGDLKPLNQTDMEKYLSELSPGWQQTESYSEIECIFRFNNYYETMAFCNVVAQIAHQQDHHPTMVVEYNRCTVRYATHSINGISIKDFICAAKINSALAL